MRVHLIRSKRADGSTNFDPVMRRQGLSARTEERASALCSRGRMEAASGKGERRAAQGTAADADCIGRVASGAGNWWRHAPVPAPAGSEGRRMPAVRRAAQGRAAG